ncbi:uncharacterized protein LOC125679335 [Ostrea edulis]|uniref:uncharacterized protein LOC125679335 n=1 Tax=Ostrea edulis TaxID=37623 RepID=UPI0024AF7D2F|nr:uncharacterized protein LOC125679335 [Ostrea edulis]
MTAAELLMKNIYTFANILSQAGCDIVAKWNHTSLQNALNWADYCIKVYHQVADKPYRGEIEKHMAAMTLHLHPPSCLRLGVEDLGKARSILERTLLNNSHLPEKLIRIILEKQQKSSMNNSIQQEQECEHLAREVTDVTKLMQTLQTNEVSHSKLISEATMLLSTLLSLISCSSNSQRFENFVSNLLTRITKKAVTLDLILKMLCVSPHDITYTDKQLHFLQSIIIQWLANSRNSALLDSKKDFIHEACRFHTDFCQLYLRNILQWAKDMEPLYNEGDSNLYSWRYRSSESKFRDIGRSRTLDKLCEHIDNLFSINKQCQILVRQSLQTQKETSHFNVYRDILKKLSHIPES